MIRGRRFSAPRWSIMLTIVGVSLFIALGSWQLDRAEFKQAIEDTYAQRLALDYRPYDPREDRVTTEYSRLLLWGRYDNAHSLLLDNQVYLGKAGYQVLTPFYLNDSDRIVLVNRGWAAWGERRDLPGTLPEPLDPGKAAGIAFYPGEAALKLGRVDLGGQWPQLIPRLDIEALRAHYSDDLLPFVLWLGSDQPGHFVRDWEPLWLPPEKSRAYALQWFAFAALAIVLFVILNLRKVE